VVIGALLSAAAICCAGCSTQAPVPLTSAVAPGQARLSIVRDRSGPWANDAHITVNGAHVADLQSGQTYTGGIRAGAVTVTVSETLDLGQYTIHFNAVPGKTYSFEVTRRTEHIAAALIGGLAGLVIETAASGEQSGDLKLVPIGR